MKTIDFLKAVGVEDKVRLVYISNSNRSMARVVDVNEVDTIIGQQGEGSLFFSPYTLKDYSKPADEANVDKTKCLVADFDNGLPEDIVLYEPSLIVHSGGLTDSGAPKAHVYWFLETPIDCHEAAKINLEIAKKLGADDSFKRPTQIIRVPNSGHYKTGKRRSVEIVYEHPFNPTVDLKTLKDTLASVDEPEPEEEYVPISNENLQDWASQLVRYVIDHDVTIEAGGVTEIQGFAVTRQDFVNSLVGSLASQASSNPNVYGILLEEAIRLVDAHVSHDGGRWDRVEVKRLFEKYFRKDTSRVELTAQPEEFKFVRRSVFEEIPLTEEPPEREILVDNLLPAGVVTAFSAQGGVGKTTLALEMCAKISATGAGAKGLDVAGNAVLSGGTAVYIGLEEEAKELHRKLWECDMCHDAWQLVKEKGNLEVYGSNRFPNGLKPVIRDRGRDRTPRVSEVWQEFCKQFEGDKSVRLIVIDNAMLIMHDSSNDDISVREVMRQLEVFRRSVNENCTILLLHHTTKVSADGEIGNLSCGDVKGSGSFLDASRHVLVAKRLKSTSKTEDYFLQAESEFGPKVQMGKKLTLLEIGVVKSNVGIPTDSSVLVAYKSMERGKINKSNTKLLTTSKFCTMLISSDGEYQTPFEKEDD